MNFSQTTCLIYLIIILVNPRPLLENFFRRHPSRVYRKGTIIFDSRQLVQGLFFVTSGRIKIATSDSRGQESIFFTLGPTDPFPLAPFFLHEPWPYTYTATTDVEAIWRPKHEVDEFLDRNPAALREIICFVLKAFYSRMQDLSLSTSQQRVIYRILYLADRFGLPTDRGVEVTITQQELADSLNLTRESISLLLNRLQSSGIVQLRRSKIYLDVDRARSLIEDAQ